MNSVLKAVFPFLSTAASMVGGPLGGAAANALGAALGCNKANPSTDELAAAYAGATPDQITAAKQAENDFALKMQQAGFQHAEELEKLADADRANARAREMSLKDNVPATLAIFITIGFFGMLAAMLKWSPPATNKDLLNVMLGSLGTAWIAVVSYYFGSSTGSADKSAVLADIAKGTK